jgi:cobalamin biosynthetic protein CobC
MVAVHPNNPDGRLWPAEDLTAPLTIIDESFCDVAPALSHVARAPRPGTLILKSFGKFWGLAGARLGFAIGDPSLDDCRH